MADYCDFADVSHACDFGTTLAPGKRRKTFNIYRFPFFRVRIPQFSGKFPRYTAARNFRVTPAASALHDSPSACIHTTNIFHDANGICMLRNVNARGPPEDSLPLMRKNEQLSSSYTYGQILRADCLLIATGK